MTIAYNAPVLFEESISGISTLLRFFEMLVGRPQNLLKAVLQLESNQQNVAVLLDLYWNMGPKRDQSDGGHKPNSFDVLLDASRNPDEFSRILSNWLDREQTWCDARFRFSNCFAKQHSYTIDRLVGAANMFDILPSLAVPEAAPLSQELKDAKDKCRRTFLALPRSDERDSFLNALGWIGEARLKHKIRHRVGMILAATGDGPFPELAVVTDAAVVCRNHYVHGSDAEFDYNSNFHAVTFFTDALEFVFAASDLADAGWDLKVWSETPTMMSHPFAAFRVNYRRRLAELKVLLGA